MVVHSCKHRTLAMAIPSPSILRLTFAVAFSLSVHLELASLVDPNAIGKQSHRTDTRRSQILDNSVCQADIPTRCGEGNRIPSTDLEALNCILNRKREEVKEINTDCNHVLWVFRQSLMTDSGFFAAIHEKCKGEIVIAGCPAGRSDQVDCAIAHKDDIKSDDCRNQVSLVERVMFSDYAVIGRFSDICKQDIITSKCGRNDFPENSPDSRFLPTSQGSTIECLSKAITNITQGCAIEILRVAELQADDYHLDRALYFACRDDRETFCKDVPAGNGKVYRCLLENKMEDRMSEGCREQLLRRQKLGARDYKVSSLPFACKSEIKKFQCRKGTDTDKHIRLSQILLCLENAGHQGQGLNGECVEEMRLHRKSLMEDHQATPELLTDCLPDSKKFCPNTKPVRTIHCLMQHAMSPRSSDRISSTCRGRLEELLKMTDVAENWSVDPVLKENCHQVVLDSSCRELPANQVMTCLMRLLTTDAIAETDGHSMTEACESTLLQIQYFMTRDFTINGVLYDDCKSDAHSICGIGEDWNTDSKNPDRGPIVLSCLYRNLIGEDKDSLGKPRMSRQCGERVREAMRERALLVRLNPDLEQNCLEDLSDLCSDRTKSGEELKCLQTNIEAVSKNCKVSIIKFTEMELKDPSIDPFLWKYCGDAIEKCKAKGAKEEGYKANEIHPVSKDEDPDDDTDGDGVDILQCLIKTKHEMKNKKCKGRVEYIQLLQLSHIEFSPKFQALCNSDVIRRCSDIKHITASKLVSCLSEHIWNDTLLDQPHRISKPCRKQVKYLTMSKVQLENDTISEGMYSICKNTVLKLCKDVVPGGGRILECLRTNKELISDMKCRAALFPLQQSVDQDTELDVFLASQCEFEIKTFCPPKVLSRAGNLLTCLKLNTNQEGFDRARCGKALQMRLVEQNSDLRLNPRLQKACRDDISKFCHRVQVGEGRILECLKEEYVKPSTGLSESCKAHVQGFLKTAAQTDVRLDYTLAKLCHQEIESYCKTDPSERSEEGGDSGKAEECLKELFRKDKLISTDCKFQVKLLIQSTELDIHVDPILHRACSIDLLKRCDGIPPGEGRLVACLLNESDREKEGAVGRLSPKCRKLLVARADLFALAGKPVQMDSFQELYVHVKESSHRNYFLLVAMSLLGVIFVFGLCCGRVTKRRSLAKDK